MPDLFSTSRATDIFDQESAAVVKATVRSLRACAPPDRPLTPIAAVERVRDDTAVIIALTVAAGMAPSPVDIARFKAADGWLHGLRCGCIPAAFQDTR